MRGQRYRIKKPTLAIHTQDGQNIPLTVPRGAEVEIIDGPLDGDRLVDVYWKDKKVMMFTSDIRERGERLDGDGNRSTDI